jgi:hypothetical protein
VVPAAAPPTRVGVRVLQQKQRLSLFAGGHLRRYAVLQVPALGIRDLAQVNDAQGAYDALGVLLLLQWPYHRSVSPE